MICKNCGEPLEEHAKFCSHCGEKHEVPETTDTSPDFQDMLDEQTEKAATSPKIHSYAGHEVKNPKPILLIIAAVFVALAVGLVAFSIVLVNTLKPNFTDEMQFVSIDGLLSSYSEDRLNNEPALVYRFDNIILANLLFPTVKEGEDIHLSFQSLRYDLEKEVMTCNASYRGLAVMINYNAALRFEEIGDDIKMTFRIQDPTFGASRLESDLLTKLIPVNMSPKSVTLPGITKNTNLADVRKENSTIALLLTADAKYVASIFHDEAMKTAIDENYFVISEKTEDDLNELLETIHFDETYLNELLAFYTPEGIEYLKEQTIFLDSVLTKDFLSSLTAEKESLNQAYLDKMEAIRRQEEALKAQQKNKSIADKLNAIKALAVSLNNYIKSHDAVEANGRVYKGFDTNNVVKVTDLDDQTVSQYYDTRTLTIVYDADFASSGICYPKEDSGFGVVFTNGMTKDITTEEFDTLYNQPKPLKSALLYPFETQNEWDEIMQALRFGSDDPKWVRYMCSDGQYAYAIISPQQQFYTVQCYFLAKNSRGAWNVVEAAVSKEDFKRIAKNHDFNDLNINIFPTPAPAEFKYVEIGVDDVLQELGLPPGFDYEEFLPAPITFYSKLGSYLYVYLQSGLDSYSYIYEYQTQNLVQIFSYAELQKLAVQRESFPIFIGLQR